MQQLGTNGGWLTCLNDRLMVNFLLRLDVLFFPSSVFLFQLLNYTKPKGSLVKVDGCCVQLIELGCCFSVRVFVLDFTRP